jgi:phosphomannomutase/phosphoglucomutase
MNPHIFREYDVRGIADTDLTDDVVEKLGVAIATFLGRDGTQRLALGRDVRPSSPRIVTALARGLTRGGADVVDVGIVPTPTLYFAIQATGSTGGVQVTGSHNPVEFNGFKICRGLGSLFGPEIQELRTIIESGAPPAPREGRLTQYEGIVDEYVAAVAERSRRGRALRIVVDSGNGTAGPVGPRILKELGHDVVEMYSDPDPTFPNHLPDPAVEEYVAELRERVVSERADVGIAYDGDADRVGVIDDRGRIIWGDRILALLAREMLARRPGAQVIFDVKCSQALPEDIKAHGGVPVMWKTGHSLIKAKMRETGAPLAGEMSGHMFFADDYYGFDDGIFASARMVSILATQNGTLSAMADSLPSYVSTPEIRVGCSDADKFEVVRQLTEEWKRTHTVIDIDGARVLFGDGWGLVRASNTQPVLVLRFEARTEERLEEIQHEFLERLSRFPSVSLEPVAH